MTIERMIELLKIEHECMLRGAHDDCDRKCADCELVQEDDELHEMYTNVVWLMEKQEPKQVEAEVINEIDRLYRCPSCHISMILRNQPYCHSCGQELKW